MFPPSAEIRQYSQIFKLCVDASAHACVCVCVCVCVCLGGGVWTGESTCVVAQLVPSQEGEMLRTAGSTVLGRAIARLLVFSGLAGCRGLNCVPRPKFIC